MTRTSSRIRPILAVLVLIGASAADAPAAGFPWRSFAARTDDWYRGDEAERLGENILSYQSERGDWPKNLDTSAAPLPR
jgi:pectate lyase